MNRSADIGSSDGKLERRDQIAQELKFQGQSRSMNFPSSTVHIYITIKLSCSLHNS